MRSSMFDKLSLVDSIETPTMIVSWDLGRRCNYDCSYCPSHRHDNFSPHAKLSELKSTAIFIFDYLLEISAFGHLSNFSISFTGGEPTMHPNFIEFGKWMRTLYKKNYKKICEDKFVSLCLTTNGNFSKAFCDNLIETYDYSTISYHCEAPNALKQRVKENIIYLKERNFPMKVNVMFHSKPEYFEECIEICNLFEKHKISFVPRMIGEHRDKNKYNHYYTKEQWDWMKKYWFKTKNNKENPSTSSKENSQNDLKQARELGRPCCGSRELKVCDAKTSELGNTKFLKFTQFKGWKCSVNLFFLHIEQQSGLIYHHQTCQARFDGTRGAIGSLKETDKILNVLRTGFKNKSMPIIHCPNNICGCGLCAPKAAESKDFKKILSRHIDTSFFENT